MKIYEKWWEEYILKEENANTQEMKGRKRRDGKENHAP